MTPMSLQQKAIFENACSIWFCPPLERTARELQQLSRSERERIWADLSGDSSLSLFDGNTEDPALAHKALLQLKEVLAIESQVSNLGMTLKSSPNYVLDESFLLKFLRAVNFDTRAAHGLLRRHFDFKRELFGQEKLGRDILLSDLDSDDMQSLGAGAFQHLSTPDAAGRLLSFCVPMRMNYKSRYNQARAYWYSYMVAANSEQVQKRGVVRIVSLLDQYPERGSDNEMMRLDIKLQDAVPLRHKAVYILVNPGFWNPTVELALIMLSPKTRLRTRLITGTQQETFYSLMCLGIPTTKIPMDEKGELKIETMSASLEQWKQQDKQKAAVLGLG